MRFKVLFGNHVRINLHQPQDYLLPRQRQTKPLFQAKKNQRQRRWLEAYGEARKQKLLQQEFLWECRYIRVLTLDCKVFILTFITFVAKNLNKQRLFSCFSVKSE